MLSSGKTVDPVCGGVALDFLWIIFFAFVFASVPQLLGRFGKRPLAARLALFTCQ
jgi:hypothetical protein